MYNGVNWELRLSWRWAWCAEAGLFCTRITRIDIMYNLRFTIYDLRCTMYDVRCTMGLTEDWELSYAIADTWKPENLKTWKLQNLKTSKPQNLKLENLKTLKPQNLKTWKPQNLKTRKLENFKTLIQSICAPYIRSIKKAGYVVHERTWQNACLQWSCLLWKKLYVNRLVP